MSDDTELSYTSIQFNKRGVGSNNKSIWSARREINVWTTSSTSENPQQTDKTDETTLNKIRHSVSDKSIIDASLVFEESNVNYSDIKSVVSEERKINYKNTDINSLVSKESKIIDSSSEVKSSVPSREPVTITNRRPTPCIPTTRADTATQTYRKPFYRKYWLLTAYFSSVATFTACNILIWVLIITIRNSNKPYCPPATTTSQATSQATSRATSQANKPIDHEVKKPVLNHCERKQTLITSEITSKTYQSTFSRKKSCDSYADHVGVKLKRNSNLASSYLQKWKICSVKIEFEEMVPTTGFSVYTSKSQNIHYKDRCTLDSYKYRTSRSLEFKCSAKEGTYVQIDYYRLHKYGICRISVYGESEIINTHRIWQGIFLIISIKCDYLCLIIISCKFYTMVTIVNDILLTIVILIGFVVGIAMIMIKKLNTKKKHSTQID